MCGITGAVWTDPKLAIDQPVLRRMTEALHHRGPDDTGDMLVDYRRRPPHANVPGVALGFRRLSVIDPAGGAQPMSNEDGSVWVVLNGEIYNFRSLRHRLEGRGHKFRTQSDTETLVHLYEDEGIDCFQLLNGMFAVAIWDAERRRLVLARDRLGQKPLVYRSQPGRLLFASELKSLLEAPGVSREIDPSAIDEYLAYQYVPHPNTIFKGIRKLPPAHTLVFQDGDICLKSYWQLDFQREQPLSEAQAAPQVRQLLTESVRMRLQSDVPLGAFLSGGVDSSLVVALMQKESSDPIRTFSIGFPEARYDETQYARQVAQYVGTEHEEFQVTPNAVEVLPKLVWHFDEPFADSSAVPTWYLSELTRKQVTVALTGDGGDELFAGYPRYRAVAIGSALDRVGLLRGMLGWPLWQALPGARQKSIFRRFKRFSSSLRETPARRYMEWIAIFHEAHRAALYRDEFLQTLPDSDPFAFLSVSWAKADQRDPITTASLVDLTTYLPCDLMTKVDIASMAHGLECRQPFLDHRLVELAASLPPRLKYRWGRGKRVLRSALGGLIPASIWKRPKMGFGVPLDQWFRNELKDMTHDVLLSETAQCRDFFHPDAIASLISQHVTGQFDHAYRLWALMVLELWLQRWVPTNV